MKKALIIIAVILVPLTIYLGILLYVANRLNNVPKPIEQALLDIKTPSYTVDLFDDDTELPQIGTSVQDDLDNLDPDLVNGLMAQYSASGYDNFLDFYQGN